MEQRHREHTHAREMFEKVERFLASALSQKEFSHQEGLAYRTFRYWLKKHRLQEVQSSQPVEEAPADFIPLRVMPTTIPVAFCLCDRISFRYRGSVQ